MPGRDTLRSLKVAFAIIRAQMTICIKQNDDGTFSAISGIEELRAIIERCSAVEVEDAVTGGGMWVHEVGDELVILSLDAIAEINSIASELVSAISRYAQRSL